VQAAVDRLVDVIAAFADCHQFMFDTLAVFSEFPDDSRISRPVAGSIAKKGSKL
jgi:hypothetical protein